MDGCSLQCLLQCCGQTDLFTAESKVSNQTIQMIKAHISLDLSLFAYILVSPHYTEPPSIKYAVMSGLGTGSYVTAVVFRTFLAYILHTVAA